MTPLAPTVRPAPSLQRRSAWPFVVALALVAVLVGQWLGHRPDRRLAWSIELGEPVVQPLAADSETVYAAGVGGSLCAVAARDGRLRWRAECGGHVSAAPVVVGAWVVAGRADGSVRLFAAADGRPGWSAAATGAGVRGLVPVGATLLALSDDWVLRGWSLADGASRFAFQLPAAPSAPPVPAAGGALLLLADGRAQLCGEDGRPRWSRQVASGPLRHPLLTRDGLRVMTDEPALLLLDPRSGAVVSQSPLPAAPVGPAGSGERLFLGYDGGRLAGWSPGASSGWERVLPAALTTPPVAVGMRVAVVAGRQLHLCAADTGQAERPLALGADAVAPPLVLGGRVLTATLAGRLLACEP